MTQAQVYRRLDPKDRVIKPTDYIKVMREFWRRVSKHIIEDAGAFTSPIGTIYCAKMLRNHKLGKTKRKIWFIDANLRKYKVKFVWRKAPYKFQK